MWAERHYTSSTLVLYSNPPDWNEMHCWASFLTPGSLFIDVGANVGVYTLYATECGANVIAIEPDPQAAHRLSENLALNGYEAQVIRSALADRVGWMTLTSGRGAMNHLAFGSEPGFGVPVTTLDELLGKRTAQGVKIDVEGAELLVLTGASRALAEHRIGMIQIEWNEFSVALLGMNRSPIVELLRSHGYSLYRPDADGALLPVDGHGFGPDVFAVPDHGF